MSMKNEEKGQCLPTYLISFTGLVIKTVLMSWARDRHDTLNNKLSLTILDTVKCIISFHRPFPGNGIKIHTIIVWSDLCTFLYSSYSVYHIA